MENDISKKIYDFLVTQDLRPDMADSQGKSTADPNKAILFSFDWRGPTGRNYGTVVILVNPESGVELYTADNLGRTMDVEDKNAWLGGDDGRSGFVPDLKRMAVKSFSNNIDHPFNMVNINRLKYTMQGIAAIREGLFEGYYGKKRMSWSDQPQHTRIMIRHSRDLAQGEPRHRAIESLFVENAAGERFRVPSRNLMHGRMLARHMAEGGTPYDAFGQHINTMIEEMATLMRFLRASRDQYPAPEAQQLMVEAARHYRDLRAKARRMIGQRGYREARDNYDPAEITQTEVVTDHLREMFTQQHIDQRIESALPVLARIQERNMREITEFERWTHQVTEGTWTMPETPEQIESLRQMLADPMPVGPDATDATERLQTIIGDDELYDRLTDLANQDAEADARPVIVGRLAELGIDLDVDVSVPGTNEPEQPEQPGMSEPDMSEDLDRNGVMMEKPSNMSSESRDRDLDRLRLLAGQ
jgi:hypothetical protein